MKKLALFGVLLVSTTGCGRGWLPGIFRGAPCGLRCGVPGPALPPAPIAGGCNDCGPNAANYGSYGGDIISSSDYYGGGVVGGDYYGGTIVDPGQDAGAMQPITPAP